MTKPKYGYKLKGEWDDMSVSERLMAIEGQRLIDNRIQIKRLGRFVDINKVKIEVVKGQK